MINSATQVTNLLYRYAELMDGGELVAASELFRHARIKTGGELKTSSQLLEQWQQLVKLYPCGTPLTKHIITNPIVEVDDGAGTASCRSNYTVFQATETLPLQAIAVGRYHDEFECVEGIWRFSYRDYSLLDLIGDMSNHLTVSLGELR